jgi:NAD-dependent dihydropyrimidine dehydrogenase PreA subunit
MEKIKRKIVHIDHEKCDGCGQCVPACAEGAIRVIEGKARLVSEVFCDGLGDCLGECPQGAIRIEEREAAPFDEAAVECHLKELEPGASREARHHGGGCPGSEVQTLRATANHTDIRATSSNGQRSRLGNWPVQIRLMPVSAPYLDGASLTIAADCAPFAYSDFHSRFIQGRVVLIGCPKLDDASFYLDKLTRIFEANRIRDIEVPYMEVPCCGGLGRIVQTALMRSNQAIPLALTKIGIGGEIVESQSIDARRNTPLSVKS